MTTNVQDRHFQWNTKYLHIKRRNVLLFFCIVTAALSCVYSFYCYFSYYFTIIAALCLLINE